MNTVIHSQPTNIQKQHMTPHVVTKQIQQQLNRCQFTHDQGS